MINVLSLFDGMSCGQIALNRAEIEYGKYFASEVDKFAIKVTQHNYPNTIQLGDITKIDISKLPKIDLLIGGSPCQGFSFAGKELNFNDPRSKLFFDFVTILKQIKPKYFLLENVLMKKEYQEIISSYLGVKPIMINSALVCAQNRKRLYWTNIPNVTLPQDKNITIKDIISGNYVAGRIVGRRLDDMGIRKDYDKKIPIKQTIETNNSLYKTNCLTTVKKDNVLIDFCSIFTPHYDSFYTNKLKKSEALINKKFRYLTPIECERLQTVPDNYTACVSNSQRYKMLGNGWTVDVIAHLLKSAYK